MNYGIVILDAATCFRHGGYATNSRLEAAVSVHLLSEDYIPAILALLFRSSNFDNCLEAAIQRVFGEWLRRVRLIVVNSQRNHLRSTVCALKWLCVLMFGEVLADEPARLREILVEPPLIQLRGTNRVQQLLITGVLEDGRQIDVTHLAEIASSDPAIARVEESLVAGVSNGEVTLLVSCSGQQLDVPVRVGQILGYPPVDFANDMLPLFSKLGCNSGGCHGKSNHPSGFKLSVFGFDPVSDFDALTKDGRGRRIFRSSPEFSLFLRKATGSVPHGGGQRLPVESADYDLMLAWVRQGTPLAQAN